MSMIYQLSVKMVDISVLGGMLINVLFYRFKGK